MTTQTISIPGTQPHVRSLRAALIFLAVGGLVALIPMFSLVYLYALVFGLAFCVIGPAWYDWQHDRLDYFEPIHLTGLIYFVFFGLGAIWTVHSPGFVAYDRYIVPYVPQATLYCLLGYAALLFGYNWFWKGKGVKGRPTEWPTSNLFLVIVGIAGFVGFLALGAIDRAVASGGYVNPAVSTLAQLSPIYWFAWALVSILFFMPNCSQQTRRLFWFFFVPATALICYDTYGDKSLVMVMAGIPIISRWYVKRHVPWTLLIVLLLVLIFIVFPLYNTYRWSDEGMAKTDRMSATLQTIQSWDSTTYMRWSLENFKRRLALINSVAVVVRDVDHWVPYANGRTIFLPALVYFVPRVVWPDKPVLHPGREFGRTFRITNMFTRNTHIAPSVPGELYWNFDLPGILVGMCMLGAWIRWIYRRYGETRYADPVRHAIMIAMLIAIAHLSGALAPSMVGMVRTLIVLEAIRWLGRYFGLLETRPAPGAAAAA